MMEIIIQPITIEELKEKAQELFNVYNSSAAIWQKYFDQSAWPKGKRKDSQDYHNLMHRRQQGFVSVNIGIRVCTQGVFVDDGKQFFIHDK